MRRLLSRIFGHKANTLRRIRPTNKVRHNLAVEALEDRCVPAALQVVNGVLSYTAGAGIANGLTVAVSGANYVFTDTKETISAPGLSGSGTHSVTLPTAFVGSMVINLGDKDDALVIESTVDPISVKCGDGNDTVDVGKLAGGTLSGIQAPVSMDGEAGTDALRVNDPASATARTYTVTATQVAATGASAVNYAGVERLTVTASDQGDTFTVRSTAAGTTTTISAGGGFDTFNVGSVANTLDDIKGPLSLIGGANSVSGLNGIILVLPDKLNLFDQGSSVGNSYTVRDNSVARTGSVLIAYTEVEQVALNAGSAADAVVVLATAANARMTLNMGGGNDNIDIATRTGTSMDLIASPVTVNGEGGTDSVSLNDQTDTTANSYVITATDVTRNGLPVLTYGTIESLTLNAGALADTAAVQGSAAATPITLKMGAGDDVMRVGSAGGSLEPILGKVSVDGQAGADVLVLNDGGDTDFGFYTVTGADVTRGGSAPVAYTGTESLFVNASQGTPFNFLPTNFFLVKGTSAATTLNGALFVRNTFSVGNDNSSLDDIHGALHLNDQGKSTIVLFDDGETTPNSYTVTESTVTRSGAAPISYAVAELLDIVAGSANDVFNVTGTAFTPVTLNLGGGNDVVNIGGGQFALDSIAQPVTVTGQSGFDAIVLNDQNAAFGGNDYRITSTDVTRNGKQIVSYSQVESLALNAGSGNDTIRLATTAAATPVIARGGLGNDTFKFEGVNASGLAGSVTLDGQGGTDTLDYSGYFFPTAIRVNLALSTATGVAGGVSNVENVIGSPGDDIIVGNDQANVLDGGPGRDIIIGRGGADVIRGGVGDDLLIGGSTVHDLKPAALEALMAEWGRTDLDGSAQSQYTARIKHLLGTLAGGENGTTFLGAGKMIDDGAADSLTGGVGLDWFFKFGADIITDLTSPERVN